MTEKVWAIAAALQIPICIRNGISVIIVQYVIQKKEE